MAGCRHWRDIWHVDQPKLMAARCCAAGVVYCELARAARPTEPNWNLRLPCTGRTGPQVRDCPSFDEQMKADADKARTQLAQTMDALPALWETARKRLEADGPGMYHEACPACGADLTFQVDWKDRRRSAVWSRGSCSTQGCVQWIT